ncbi:hypothetical protein J6590_026141 [Homalodisca vitripennis]|nr:hypothetical protein J6590_026141 [Homalodisca vitripennis]
MLQMVANRCAVCLICLASLVAMSAQDLYTNQKRDEVMQETYLPDHQFSNRDARQSKFWSGSRYGRAGQDVPQPRLEVEPRGDRFFMGSRYGKRSGAWSDGDATSQLLPLLKHRLRENLTSSVTSDVVNTERSS